MFDDIQKKTVLIRPFRAPQADEVSFISTAGRVTLLFNEETVAWKLVNLLFILGIPACFIVVAVFKIDELEPKLIFILMAVVVVFYATGGQSFSLDAREFCIVRELRHAGICTYTRKETFSPDCKFVVKAVSRNAVKRKELVLTNGIENHYFFQVTDAKSYSDFLIDLNLALSVAIGSKEQ